MTASQSLPEYAQNLINIIHRVPGQPPDRGRVLGVNAFYDKIEPGSDLDSVALSYYQRFVGEKWHWQPHNWTPEDGIIWLEVWNLAYQRPPSCSLDLFDELKYASALSDIEMGLDALYNSLDLSYSRDYNSLGPSYSNDYDTLRDILVAAFSAPEVTDFRVYDLGDGEVIEGFLALGYRDNGEIIVLAYLND